MVRDLGLEEVIRADLGERAGLTEKLMFGGCAFLLNGHMFCAARDAGMLIRLGKGNDGWALALPDIAPMVMAGTLREGWLRVGPQAYGDDKLRQRLLDGAVAFAETLPAKSEPGKSLCRHTIAHPNFPIPGGGELRAKGWRQEGLLRLLENVLAVGENPDELIVYAALGKAARNWAAHDAIVQALKTMDEDQTLIIQSGKPIGVLRTHAKAPLVIMANCNIVGQWAKAEYFYEIERKGLIAWGGLTAGAWQ